jgi:hypothetical protein
MDLFDVDLELVVDDGDELDPDVFRGLLAEWAVPSGGVVSVRERVGVWVWGDVEELADEFIEVAYGLDLDCVVIVDGDVEDFFGADDEFYDVEAHGGMLVDGVRASLE